MSRAIYETTLLLGSLSEKYALLNQKTVPSFYANSLLEDMLKMDHFSEAEVSSKTTPAQIISKLLSLDYIKYTHKNFHKVIALHLEGRLSFLHTNLVKLLQSSHAHKNDWIYALNFYLQEIDKNHIQITHIDVLHFAKEMNQSYPDLSPSLVAGFIKAIKVPKKFSFLYAVYTSLDGRKIFNKKDTDILLTLCKEEIKQCDTKDLVNAVQTYTRYRYDYDEEPSREMMTYLKQILATREHIYSKAQKTLIRKMSAKVKSKLTLREAQLLNNKLKRKK